MIAMKNQNHPEFKNFDRQSISNLPESFARVSTSINHIYNQLTVWFKTLPKWGKSIVVVSSIIVGIKVLETILKLISLSISLLIIGGGIYLVYKFFITNTSSEENTK